MSNVLSLLQVLIEDISYLFTALIWILIFFAIYFIIMVNKEKYTDGKVRPDIESLLFGVTGTILYCILMASLFYSEINSKEDISDLVSKKKWEILLRHYDSDWVNYSGKEVPVPLGYFYSNDDEELFRLALKIGANPRTNMPNRLDVHKIIWSDYSTKNQKYRYILEGDDGND